MENLAAYFLLKAGGKDKPSEGDISSVLSSVGIEGNTEMISLLVSKLSETSFDEVMNQGLSKLSAVAVAPGAGSSAAPVEAEAEKEEEKEEVAEESESESDSDDEMGLDLFD